MATPAEEAPKTFDIPKQYKAIIYDNPGTISTKIVTLDTPSPGPGELLVRITHSGVCHSDLGIMTNSWKTLPFPTQPGQVGGHEGVGVVHALGPAIEGKESKIKVGDRVGIKWVASACGSCAACDEGADGNQKISGYYTPGTFQQYLLTPSHYATLIPPSLPSHLAAPLLCAGLTTYSALLKSRTSPGNTIVISGAGGGLGHLAVQIASRGMGLKVIGLDVGDKEEIVKESGAASYFDVSAHTEDEVTSEIHSLTSGLGAHAVMVCTASNAAYAHSLSLLRFNGTLVCVGIPESTPLPISTALPGKLIAKQLAIVGSAVGNRGEAEGVLGLAAKGVVGARVRVVGMEELTEVFGEMGKGKVEGRVVVDLQ